MKKILLFINSSSHKIFQNNIKALVTGYNRIIKRHGLNIDVRTVTGIDRNEPRKSYVEDIVINTIEYDLAKVDFEALEIFTRQQYDVIVKTNTNTVINLQLLQKFCDSQYFENDVIYTSWFMYDDFDEDNIITFPSGTFIMSTPDVWKQIINHIDEGIEFCKKYEGIKPRTFIPNSMDNKNLLWQGFPDDYMVGVINSMYNIAKKRTLLNSTVSQSRHVEFKDVLIGSVVMTDISEKYLAINAKLDTPYDASSGKSIIKGSSSYEEYYRAGYEYRLIEALCKMFEFAEITSDDVWHMRQCMFFN